MTVATGLTALPQAVTLDDENSQLLVLDQTLLPNTTQVLRLKEQSEIRQAIKILQVRGAPAIGIAAAFGAYLAAKQYNGDDRQGFIKHFSCAKDELAAARPTAVNLCWALQRMEQVIIANQDKSVAVLKELLKEEALRIEAEDKAVCRSIGENGLTLIKDGDGILTHCNAGQLATSVYGTALAPVYVGMERGMRFNLYCDETRPLLQGARLTAYELTTAGVDTTLICDNMAASVMSQGWVQAVFVGCDRVAANGDAANKIGTSAVAIVAKYYGIPFYVCAPFSSIDKNCASGKDIPIEQRSPEEVSELWYANRMAPASVKIYNPAFDVTPAELIAAFVTERGIIQPPYAFAADDKFK